MARPLAAMERFFERLFERPAALLFRTRLQPIQLQRRLERAMEAERRFSSDRIYVPNRYFVRLHPEDLEDFTSYQATLESDLADAILNRARNRGYSLLERPTVTLQPSDAVDRSEIEVEADVLDPLLLRPAPQGFRKVRDGAARDDVARSGTGTASQSGGPGAGSIDQTAVFPIPQAQTPWVGLVVQSPGRPPERFVHRGGKLRLGRAADNDLALEDDQVSRHHGQLTARQGALVYTDLGSTNGSYANGARVTEIALGPGDVLQLGNTTVTIDPAG